MRIVNPLMDRKRMTIRAMTTSLLLLLSSLPETAGAETCTVPVPYKTVPAAVADLDCSLVVIAPDTHLGSVTVARTLTLQVAGQGITIIGGALKVRGQSTELTLSSLSINTTGALAGCFPVAIEVTDGAVVYPEAIVVDNASGLPTGSCHVYSDSFESVKDPAGLHASVVTPYIGFIL